MVWSRRVLAPVVLVLGLALPALPSPAQEGSDAAVHEAPAAGDGLASVLRELSLSGFLDVTASDRASDPNVFAMGDLEVDLARELGRHVQVAAALVANEDGTSLAVGFVDVHLLGGLVAPRGRLPVEKGFHVQLGRFDVPFGNDWQHFAAKDRIEASAPLTTDELMDGGANDVGLRLVGTDGTFHYTAFVLRGEGSGNAFGGRVGVAPFDVPYRFPPRIGLFEAGLSILHDVDGDGATEKTALALDATARRGALLVRGEYVRTDARAAEGRVTRAIRSGWHVTAAFEAGAPGGIRVTPYARYDAADGAPSEATSDPGRTRRLTAGANATLLGHLTFKAEYRRTLEAPAAVRLAEGSSGDAWLAQAVVSF